MQDVTQRLKAQTLEILGDSDQIDDPDALERLFKYAKYEGQEAYRANTDGLSARVILNEIDLGEETAVQVALLVGALVGTEPVFNQAGAPRVDSEGRAIERTTWDVIFVKLYDGNTVDSAVAAAIEQAKGLQRTWGGARVGQALGGRAFVTKK